MAFRILVKKSAIGSVIDIKTTPHFLPACFNNAGNFTFMRQLSEAEAAYPKFSVIGSGPAAALAAVVFTHFKFLSSFGFGN